MNNFIKNNLNLIKKYNFPDPELELRALLNHCSNNSDIILFHNFKTNRINIEKFNTAFQRRLNYEPISKIFNIKQFWSLDFYVNHFVLDPRPESEFLIQAIREHCPELKSNIRICDLGTGSGCLAITLAKMFKKSKITAVDISKEAIKVAKKNAIKHKVENQIKFINCNWLSFTGKYDLIVSNPPYLSKQEYNNCNINIKKFEPKISLLGGLDGLESYRQISKIAHSILYNNSFVFIEIGKAQLSDIKNIFFQKKLQLINIIKDYQQIDRVLVLKKI